MRILTLNAGSNSLKFELVRAPQGNDSAKRLWGDSILAGSFDDLGKGDATLNIIENKRVVHAEPTSARSYDEAARFLFEWIERGAGKPYGIDSLEYVDRIAHRVVHGADQFAQIAAITGEVIDQIGELEELAPLHNEPARKVMRVARAVMGSDVPMFAVFDTAFHRSIPDAAALYPLPLKLARRHRIRRYGFHGLSHQYLALRMAEILGRPVEELKLITLHLEGGSSAAAIRNGQSIDTSMGFTPLEGLMMGTRSGDIDPAIMLYLMRKEGWDAGKTERYLNKGGADAIVFGGGISENTPLIRERISAGFDWCGAVLDEARNAEVIDREGRISSPDALLPLWVIATQEGLMMAHHVARA